MIVVKIIGAVLILVSGYMFGKHIKDDMTNRSDVIFYINKALAYIENKIVIENAYLDDPEYGLIPAKPVFVNGFWNDKEYLSHLHAEDGTKLSFTRVGSSKFISSIDGNTTPYPLVSALFNASLIF